MEWEEALLIARGGELPLHPAAHYRRQAARARQIAVAVTTRAMKARLLDDAARYDELAAEARSHRGRRYGFLTRFGLAKNGSFSEVAVAGAT